MKREVETPVLYSREEFKSKSESVDELEDCIETISDEELVKDTYRLNLKLAEMANECSRGRRNFGSRTGKQYSINSNDIASQALKLLRLCPDPDTVAFNSVLKAVAKVRRIDGRPAALVAERLLQEMKEIHEKQRNSKDEWYRRLGSGELNEGHLSQGAPIVRVKPNCRSYSTVLDALSKDRSCVGRMEAILKELEQAYESTGDVAMMPNLITYNTVLSGYARSGVEYLDNCLELFENMPYEADVISYNNVLHALARAGKGEDAFSMIQRMIEAGVCPNARSYTTVLDAFGQAKQPEKAYDLLLEMEKLSKNDASLAPNTISYSTVIHAYAVSKRRDKAQKAYELVKRMSERDIRPNQVTMNSVLNACASSVPEDNEKALELMKHSYNWIVKEFEPDQYTFGTLLKGMSNARWSDTEFCCRVFQEACRRGAVTSGVLHQLRQAVPIDVYRKLVGGDDSIRWNALPQTWTRNIKEGKQRR